MTQAQSLVKQGFQTPDGQLFATRAEAMDHMRRPEKIKAFNAINGNNADLTEWMLANEDAIQGVYESTKIQRVTKAEKAQLVKALDAVTKAHATVTPGAAEGDAPVVTNVEKAFAFIIENAAAIADSFRWPSVKRVSEEEQAASIRQGFLNMAGEDNAELVDWLISSKEAVLAAYDAGIVKKEVNPKAAEALAKYRADKAAEKAAKEAAASEKA